MRAKDQNSSTGWTKAASLARLPLALVAMVATVSLASVADAAQRSGSSGGGGGRVIIGGGKIGTSSSTRAITAAEARAGIPGAAVAAA